MNPTLKTALVGFVCVSVLALCGLRIYRHNQERRKAAEELRVAEAEARVQQEAAQAQIAARPNAQVPGTSLVRSPSGVSRVAVLSGWGERAPAPAIAAQLEVGLSRQDGIMVLEREAMREVLAEQALRGSRITDPRTAVQMGKRLAADLLVLVERPPAWDTGNLPPELSKRFREILGTPPEAVQVHVMETRTGICLGSHLEEQKALQENLSAAGEFIMSCVSKHRRAREDRRLVRLMGVQSTESDHSLDVVAWTLTCLLGNELVRAPQVLLLNREYVQWVRTEPEIADLSVGAEGVAWLLEGGMKRVPGEGKLEVTVKVSPWLDQESKQVTVKIPLDDLAAGRRLVGEAVLNALQAEPLERSDADAEKESARYTERWRLLLGQGDLDGAVVAAEAAYALRPTDSKRNDVDGQWSFLDSNLTWLDEMDRDTASRRSPEGMQRRLRLLLAKRRRLELNRERCLGNCPTCCQPFQDDFNGLQYVRLEPGDTEAWALLKEVGDVITDVSRQRIARAEEEMARDEKAGRRPGVDGRKPPYGELLNPAYAALWTGDVPEWARRFRESVTQFETFKTREGRESVDQLDFPRNFPGKMQRASDRITDPEARLLMYQTLDWACRREDPLIRYVGAIGLAACFRENAQDKAKAAIEVLRKLPLTHPYRQGESKEPGGSDPTLAQDITAYAFGALRDPAEVDTLSRTVLEPILASGNARAVERWGDLILKRMDSLQQLGRQAEALDWAGGIQKLLIDFNAPDAPPPDGSLVARLTDRIAGARPALETVPAPPPEWERYEIRPIHYGLPPPWGSRLEVSLVVEGWLILGWSHKDETGPSQVGCLLVSPDGSQRLFGGSWAIRGGGTAYGGTREITSGCVLNKAVYFGTSGSGLVRFGLPGFTVWREAHGLPSDNVRTVAAHLDRIYLGFGNRGSAKDMPVPGALTEFDPATEKCRLLASNRAPKKNSELDGGAPYCVSRLLPDTKRNCLWIAVEEQHPLWQYSPATGRIEKAKGMAENLRDMRWDEGKILAFLAPPESRGSRGGKQTRVVEIDPDLLVMSTPPPFRSLDRSGKEAGTAAARPVLWPCARLGKDRIVAAGDLVLYSEGKPPAVLTHDPYGRKFRANHVIRVGARGQEIQGLSSLHVVPGGLVVGTEEGDLYFVRPKAGGDTSAPAGSTGSPAKATREACLIDLLTGDPIPSSDLEATKEFGAVVAAIYEKGPADAAGLRRGDIVLAADEFRVWGDGELSYVLAKYPDRTSLRLIINRDGNLRPISLQDLRSPRRGECTYDRQRFRFEALLDRLHVPVPPERRASLSLLPPRAAALIEIWTRTRSPSPADIQWLQEFLQLFCALTNQDYAQAEAPRSPAPIPFLNRLARFYVSVARKSLNEEASPNWYAHGETLDFYTLFYPFPRYVRPALGRITMRDREFIRWLTANQSRDITQDLAARRDAAQAYAQSGEGVELYVNQVKASILDRLFFRRIPYASAQVAEKEARLGTLRALNERLDARDEDMALYATALLAPTVMENQIDRVRELLDLIHQQSPYLALEGLEIVGRSSDYWAEAQKGLLTRVGEHARETLFPFLTPRRSALISACLRIRSQELSWNGFGLYSLGPYSEIIGYGDGLAARPEMFAWTIEMLSEWPGWRSLGSN